LPTARKQSVTAGRTPRKPASRAKKANGVSAIAAKEDAAAVPAPAARGESARQLEQLAIIAVAALCGVIGFAVHLFWFASIVLMALLFGLIAAGLRGSRAGGGVLSGVVAEVKSAAEELTSGEETDEQADSAPPST
jgi:hypothetical protein